MREYHYVCSDNLLWLRRDWPVFDLILTSPPYQTGKEYEEKQTLEEYIAGQREVLTECVGHLSDKGSICWQVGNHITPNGEVIPLDCLIFPIMRDIGLKCRNRIVWNFGHGLHCSKRFSGRHETILWFTKTYSNTFNLDAVRVPQKYPGKKHFKGPKKGQLSCNPLGCNPGDVWQIPNVKSNHVEKTIHPCQFPVALAERLILALTNPGDKVFDPYAGVATTLVAALKNDRCAVGCETNADYYEAGIKRLNELRDGTLKTRPLNKPIYEPR